MAFVGLKISTHTLTWSVTYQELPNLSPKYISTHTLTWSVTFGANKTLPVNCISTHTLTWSVTLPRRVNLVSMVHFNSHAHVERDLCDFTYINVIRIFQLTRSRGA